MFKISIIKKVVSEGKMCTIHCKADCEKFKHWIIYISKTVEDAKKISTEVSTAGQAIFYNKNWQVPVLNIISLIHLIESINNWAMQLLF